MAVGFALSACAGPVILSPYGSTIGANNLQRRDAHAGADFGEIPGAPILAAADGKVVTVGENAGCGLGVLILHLEFLRYTVYCHLQKAVVKVGQVVKRGDVIGLVGATGKSGGIPHIHLELLQGSSPRLGSADGNLHGTEDPLAIAVGCFDPQKTYPTDKLVLTYPVQCKD